MPRRQSKFLFACARLARETTHRNPKTDSTLRFRPLVYRAVAGQLIPYLGHRLSLHGTLSGLSIREGRPLNTGDAEHDERVSPALARELGIRSMTIAPIARHGGIVGVLKLQSSKPHAFKHADGVTAQLLAGVVAGGLGNVAEAEVIRNLRASEETLRLAQEAGQFGTFETDVETSITKEASTNF